MLNKTSDETGDEAEPLLPPSGKSGVRGDRARSVSRMLSWIILLTPLFLGGYFVRLLRSKAAFTRKAPLFFSSVHTPQEICQGEHGKGTSHAGYIGLDGDSEERPKRSFFWYFEAQENHTDAPVILTIGGGPGTSGMLNPLRAQSHCMITSNRTTIPNPDAWTERFNLLALDHPIGAGFSYGTLVNNSRSAAIDVYDFLQKFYSLYPHLVKNKFIVSGDSYGGTYVPWIATVIHEGNHAIALGRGRPGVVHINLESLMLSNPYSDMLSYNRWFLHQACYNTNLYNSTTCFEFYKILPACLESIQFAYENPAVENRLAALGICNIIQSGDAHGTMPENVDKKCNGTVEDCFPDFAWLSEFLNNPSTKKELGVPEHIKFETLSDAVGSEFNSTGDLVQQAYLLYEPLLKDGIRLLHYVGAKDTNCGWPGIFSFLKLLRTPYQQRFIHAADVPWTSAGKTTVRVVGEGAGDMTYILVANAGHFVTRDQPALAKNIIEHWIDNRPFE